MISLPPMDTQLELVRCLGRPVGELVLGGAPWSPFRCTWYLEELAQLELLVELPTPAMADQITLANILKKERAERTGSLLHLLSHCMVVGGRLASWVRQAPPVEAVGDPTLGEPHRRGRVVWVVGEEDVMLRLLMVVQVVPAGAEVELLARLAVPATAGKAATGLY